MQSDSRTPEPNPVGAVRWRIVLIALALFAFGMLCGVLFVAYRDPGLLLDLSNLRYCV